MRIDPEIVKAGMEKIEMKRRQMKNRKPAHKFFDYLVVIDFEATCFGRDNSEFCQEIIQFPAVLVELETLTIKDEFCKFVKPVLNPQLTEYCTNLTGITQDMVENGMLFAKALQRFEEWLLSHDLGTKYTFTIVTDGCYDMGRFLYKQCQLSGIKYPTYAYRWMNIRKVFCLFYHIRWYSIQLAVEMLGEKFQGRPHNGSDDALNIAKVVISLLKDGGEAIENERILLNEEDQFKNGLAIQNDRRIWFGLDTVQNITRKEFLLFNRMESMKSYSYDEGSDELSEDSAEMSGKENIDTEEESEGYSSSSSSGNSSSNGDISSSSSSSSGHSTNDFGSYPDPMSFSSYCPVHGHMASYYVGSPRARCSYACRVSSLNQIMGAHHYLPANHIYHPKYPVLYPLSRRSNYPTVNTSGSDQTANSVPVSRAQRPPGMLRRAFEAAVAASENVH